MAGVVPGCAGTASAANGSVIGGTRGFQQFGSPVPHIGRAGLGAVAGPPQTPKSAPSGGVFGPAWVRSTLVFEQAPLQLTAFGSLEFTWILWDGPPTILTPPLLPPPFMLSVPLPVGLRTKIGMGAEACNVPQAAKARTSCVLLPLSKPAKYVCT